MDDCSRQDPAYRPATEKPRLGGVSLLSRAVGCRGNGEDSCPARPAGCGGDRRRGRCRAVHRRGRVGGHAQRRPVRGASRKRDHGRAHGDGRPVGGRRHPDGSDLPGGRRRLRPQQRRRHQRCRRDGRLQLSDGLQRRLRAGHPRRRPEDQRPARRRRRHGLDQPQQLRGARLRHSPGRRQRPQQPCVPRSRWRGSARRGGNVTDGQWTRQEPGGQPGTFYVWAGGAFVGRFPGDPYIGQESAPQCQETPATLNEGTQLGPDGSFSLPWDTDSLPEYDAVTPTTGALAGGSGTWTYVLDAPYITDTQLSQCDPPQPTTVAVSLTKAQPVHKPFPAPKGSSSPVPGGATAPSQKCPSGAYKTTAAAFVLCTTVKPKISGQTATLTGRVTINGFLFAKVDALTVGLRSGRLHARGDVDFGGDPSRRGSERGGDRHSHRPAAGQGQGDADDRLRRPAVRASAGHQRARPDPR